MNKRTIAITINGKSVDTSVDNEWSGYAIVFRMEDNSEFCYWANYATDAIEAIKSAKRFFRESSPRFDIKPVQVVLMKYFERV